MSLESRDFDESKIVDAIRARTPARLLVGQAGPAYRTETQLQLRLDHAAARDAVHAELDSAWLALMKLPELRTEAETHTEFLLRPERGRRFRAESRKQLAVSFPKEPALQIVIGDGLSATAVVAQVPDLLPRLLIGAAKLGWNVGQTFAVRYCRVGIMNHVGEILSPEVVVLLIGERPGLATAESLSAYMAYRPRSGHTDAQRNLISNIHARGVSHEDAARRILALAGTMMQLQTSGVGLKESRHADAHIIPPS